MGEEQTSSMWKAEIDKVNWGSWLVGRWTEWGKTIREEDKMRESI